MRQAGKRPLLPASERLNARGAGLVMMMPGPPAGPVPRRPPAARGQSVRASNDGVSFNVLFEESVEFFLSAGIIG